MRTDTQKNDIISALGAKRLEKKKKKLKVLNRMNLDLWILL